MMSSIGPTQLSHFGRKREGGDGRGWEIGNIPSKGNPGYGPVFQR